MAIVDAVITVRCDWWDGCTEQISHRILVNEGTGHHMGADLTIRSSSEALNFGDEGWHLGENMASTLLDLCPKHIAQHETDRAANELAEQLKAHPGERARVLAELGANDDPFASVPPARPATPGPERVKEGDEPPPPPPPPPVKRIRVGEVPEQ